MSNKSRETFDIWRIISATQQLDIAATQTKSTAVDWVPQNVWKPTSGGFAGVAVVTRQKVAQRLQLPSE